MFLSLLLDHKTSRIDKGGIAVRIFVYVHEQNDVSIFIAIILTRRGAAYRPHGFLQYNIDAKFLNMVFPPEFC